GMKPGADLEKAADAAAQLDPSRIRPSYAAENFQQCTFARAVAADDADHLAWLYVEAHVLQRPEVFLAGFMSAVAETAQGGGGQIAQLVAQGLVAFVAGAFVADAVALAEVFNADRGLHGESNAQRRFVKTRR